jgi:hypothetical protein
MQQINDNLIVLNPGDQLDDSMSSYYLKIFLAGSVDLADTFNWQDKFIQGMSKLVDPRMGDPRFKGKKYILLNPRTNITNPAASLDNPEFTTKFSWELAMIKAADAVFCNFLKRAQAPIGMYEFCLAAYTGKTIVRCPMEYFGYPFVKLVSQDQGGALSILGDKATVIDVLLEMFNRIPVFQETTKYGLD